MAEDLRERQVGLGHGHVAPQLVGDLMRGAGPCGDQAGDLRRRGGRACAGAGRSGPHGRVIGSPWPGSTSPTSIARVAPASPCTSMQRPGPRALRRPGGRPAAGRAAGSRRCGRAGGRPRSGSRAARRGTRCPRGCGRAGAGPRSVRSRTRSASPSSQRPCDLDRLAPGAEAGRDRAQPGDDLAGIPWRSISALSEVVFAVGLAAVGGEVAGERGERGHLRSRAPRENRARPKWSMCWWLMTSSSRSSMRCPRAASSCSSSSSAFAEFGPESMSVSGSSSIRYALTRPTWNGVGIADPVDARLGGAASPRARRAPVAHERISASTSSRRAPCPRPRQATRGTASAAARCSRGAR